MPSFTPSYPTNRPYLTSNTHSPYSTPLFEYRPPQRFNRYKQLPALRGMRAYETIHRFVDDRIKTYVEAPRSNFVATPSEAAINELREADGLPANNVDARVAFTRTVLHRLCTHPGVEAGPLYMVTVCPRRFGFRVGDEGFALRHLRAPACRDGEAANFDVRRMQGLVRQALGDVDFVGMVELGLWKNWGPDGPFRGDWVSWHAHMLTWGATRDQLQTCLAPLRARETPFYCHGSVVDVREFDRSELVTKAAYILKAPLKHYRVGYCKHAWMSRTTGEIRPPGLRVNKDWMRPGDRVRLLEVFVGRSLDRLFFGGCAGTAVARAVRAKLCSTA